MNYTDLAMKILEYVGGEENVRDVFHCATRLRFNLIDRKKAKTKEIEALPGVSGVAKNEAQYQVIIGPDVPNVYRPIAKVLENRQDKTEENSKKGNWKEKFIDTVSGIFSPTLPALAASGMLKVILALLLSFNVVDKQNSTYLVINFMADATFYFYPIFLAYTASKKFGCSPMLAMLLGAMLVHPNFVSMVNSSIETGNTITIFGLPIYNATYSNSVIPVILGVWLMGIVEPFADKISPKAIKFFTRPLITILITGIATLCVLGPIGSIVSAYLGEIVKKVDSGVSWLVPMIMGAIQPFTLITGTGGGFFSVAINNRITMGYDAAFYPGWLASNVAIGAATLAFSCRIKDKELKQLASSTGITAICGITEPAIFGVNIKHKNNLIACSLGGAVGGFFMGLFNVKNFFGGSPGLLTLPSYMSPDYPMSNFYLACAGALIAFAVSFAVAYILNKPKALDSEKKNEMICDSSSSNEKSITLYSPMKGKSIALKDVNDSTFANEIVGKGAAILPEEGKVYSPASGKIVSVFPNKHAVLLLSEDGVEIMIHIGIDTVNLQGKYFDVKVHDGDDVECGDLLVEFNLEKILEEGYDSTTMVIVTNTDAYEQVNSVIKDVQQNEEIIKIVQK